MPRPVPASLIAPRLREHGAVSFARKIFKSASSCVEIMNAITFWTVNVGFQSGGISLYRETCFFNCAYDYICFELYWAAV